jgi:hypothetical protein
VLKNSLARLLAAIFESMRSAQQLLIASIRNGTNQYFRVYRPPDFFNNIRQQYALKLRWRDGRIAPKDPMGV